MQKWRKMSLVQYFFFTNGVYFFFSWDDECKMFSTVLLMPLRLNGMLSIHRWYLLYTGNHWRWLSTKSYKIKTFKAASSAIIREVCVWKLISKYRIHASIARNGRLFWQTSSFCYFVCVQCWAGLTSVSVVMISAHLWLLSPLMATLLLQNHPKTDSFHYSPMHVTPTASQFWFLIHDEVKRLAKLR